VVAPSPSPASTTGRSRLLTFGMPGVERVRHLSAERQRRARKPALAHDSLPRQ